MKTSAFAMAATVVSSLALLNSATVSADPSRIGDSVTIGCTLPVGYNGSHLYSIDNRNQNNADIDFTPSLPKIGNGEANTCSQAINLLTPKTENTSLFNRLILNCGPLGGNVANGFKLGVWQAAGQTAANPFFPSVGADPVTNGLVSTIFAAQSAPPGPPQPVLLAPGNSDYALVSYSFVCALDVGNLSLFAINVTQTPGN